MKNEEKTSICEIVKCKLKNCKISIDIAFAL